MIDELEVWLLERCAGALKRDDLGGLTFSYAEDWIAEGGPPLSLGLPVRPEPFESGECGAFFSGLLPEGRARSILDRRFRAGDDFKLLQAIGGECAGAVSLVAPGGRAEARRAEAVRWLSEDELVRAIEDLPTHPLLADPEQEVRLSLAGAQDKMVVVCDEGRIGIPSGSTPSTHILKTPIAQFPETVANEAYCMRLAGTLGLSVASARPERVGDHEYLLVERYDRRLVERRVTRLHQEDFGQALGISSYQKYEEGRRGGPSLTRFAELIEHACSTPALDLMALVDSLAFNILVGNNDAHSKNYALLYHPDGTRLAPLYDLISTAVYPELSRRMALMIGRENRPDRLQMRHVERFATEVHLGVAPIRRRMLDLAGRTAEMAPKVAGEMAEEGWGSPLLDKLAERTVRWTKVLERALGARE